MRHNIKIGQRRSYFDSLSVIAELQTNDLEAKGNEDQHTVGYVQALHEIGHCLAPYLLRSGNPEIRDIGNKVANIACQAGFSLMGLETHSPKAGVT